MKKVLLLAWSMIPSVRLCGHEQLSLLAQRGEIEYRSLLPNRAMLPDIRWADVVVSVRGDSELDALLMDTARKSGKYCIYVLDDDLLDLPEGLDSSSFYLRPETKAAVRSTMRACHCFLSPSRTLLEKYGGEFERVCRIEEPALPGPKTDRKPHAALRIGFAGSVDRGGDIDRLLSGALRRVLTGYPGRVTVEFFGARPALVDEFSLKFIPYTESYEDYQKTMASLDWDIGLAPMPDTPFHRCKHYNKYIEYASFGIPCVFSDVVPYRWAVRHGENGLLCENTEEAWYRAICSLLDDEALRGTIRETCLREAEKLYSVGATAQVWREVIDEGKGGSPHLTAGWRFTVERYGKLLKKVLLKLREWGWRTPFKLAKKIFLRLK